MIGADHGNGTASIPLNRLRPARPALRLGMDNTVTRLISFRATTAGFIDTLKSREYDDSGLLYR
jgi:hypothetical protein